MAAEASSGLDEVWQDSCLSMDIHMYKESTQDGTGHVDLTQASCFPHGTTA